MAESSITSKHWSYESKWFLWAFTPKKAVVYHSNFSAFQASLKLGFLCSTMRHFCSVFLFDSLKWISTICHIYSKPDMQTLKLFCFMVANTWKWQNTGSWLVLTIWQCLLNRRTPILPTCETTSNVGWGLLILH